MSVFVASLNSGSNGNCYYIGCGDDAVLIDGGISRRETEKRLKRLGLSIKKIRAVFITHEHGDHIHGVPSLAKKYKLPVYITRETYRNAPAGIPEDTVRYFQSFDEIAVGSLNVMAFRNATTPSIRIASWFTTAPYPSACLPTLELPATMSKNTLANAMPLFWNQIMMLNFLSAAAILST